MNIPQDKLDYLAQVSTCNQIPLEALKEFYAKQINNPEVAKMFSTSEELCEYVDILLGTFIEDYVGTVLTSFEIFVLASSAPRLSKAGSLYNNHIVVAKRPNDEKVKIMVISNFEANCNVVRFNPMDCGIMAVNVKNETDNRIEAQARQSSDLKPVQVPWVPVDMPGRKALMKKLIKTSTLIEAGKNISDRTADGHFEQTSLRIIEGVVSSHYIGKTKNNDREFAVVNVVDRSVNLYPDFFKDTVVADPKDPTKTITIRGGFSVFLDPVDAALIGQRSECMFIGTITGAKNMNAVSIVPIIAIKPKRATEKLAAPAPGAGTEQQRLPDANTMPDLSAIVIPPVNTDPANL